MIFSTLTFLFSASLLGCFTTQETYPMEMAQLGCDFTYNCYKASFLDEWDDTEECMDDAEEDVEDQEDFLEDCDFDQEKAAECLTAMRAYSMSCSEDDGEEVEDACEDVYDDCGG